MVPGTRPRRIGLRSAPSSAPPVADNEDDSHYETPESGEDGLHNLPPAAPEVDAAPGAAPVPEVQQGADAAFTQQAASVQQGAAGAGSGPPGPPDWFALCAQHMQTEMQTGLHLVEARATANMQAITQQLLARIDTLAAQQQQPQHQPLQQPPLAFPGLLPQTANLTDMAELQQATEERGVFKPPAPPSMAGSAGIDEAVAAKFWAALGEPDPQLLLYGDRKYLSPGFHKLCNELLAQKKIELADISAANTLVGASRLLLAIRDILSRGSNVADALGELECHLDDIIETCSREFSRLHLRGHPLFKTKEAADKHFAAAMSKRDAERMGQYFAGVYVALPEVQDMLIKAERDAIKTESLNLAC